MCSRCRKEEKSPLEYFYKAQAAAHLQNLYSPPGDLHPGKSCSRAQGHIFKLLILFNQQHKIQRYVE